MLRLGFSSTIRSTNLLSAEIAFHSNAGLATAFVTSPFLESSHFVLPDTRARSSIARPASLQHIRRPSECQRNCCSNRSSSDFSPAEQNSPLLPNIPTFTIPAISPLQNSPLPRSPPLRRRFHRPFNKRLHRGHSRPIHCPRQHMALPQPKRSPHHRFSTFRARSASFTLGEFNGETTDDDVGADDDNYGSCSGSSCQGNDSLF